MTNAPLSILLDGTRGKLIFSNAVGSNPIYNVHGEIDLKDDNFISVKMEQYLDGNGLFIFSVFIGDVKIESVINDNPLTFDNVAVYTSDPEYPIVIEHLDVTTNIGKFVWVIIKCA